MNLWEATVPPITAYVVIVALNIKRSGIQRICKGKEGSYVLTPAECQGELGPISKALT